eukprot:3411359-Prymnesium_polylepis.2
MFSVHRRVPPRAVYSRRIQHRRRHQRVARPEPPLTVTACARLPDGPLAQQLQARRVCLDLASRCGSKRLSHQGSLLCRTVVLGSHRKGGRLDGLLAPALCACAQRVVRVDQPDARGRREASRHVHRHPRHRVGCRDL